MIFVDRNALNIPWDDQDVVMRDIKFINERMPLTERIYSNYKIKELRNKLPGRSRRSSVRYREALTILFNNKCAYCEQCIPDITMYIDNFRPGSGVIDVETGKAFPLHYLWLRNSWSNLYLSCPECNGRKGNKFPIAGPICELFATGDELAYEMPLLLDPCDPQLRIEEHLDFIEDGTVLPLSERGEMTINILGLNRPSLVGARKLHAVLLLQQLKANANEDRINDFLKTHNGQFLALSQQLISQFNQRVIAKPKQEYHSKMVKPAEKIRLYGPKIKRIIIKDIGPISGKHIIELSDDNDVWLMLLGDNGVGKSTLLKLAALLLAGEKRATDLLRELNVSLTDFLRYGAKEGYIKLLFTRDFPELILTITPHGAIFSDSARRVSPIVLNAYGASRLHPNARHPAKDRVDTCYIDTLFDSFEPLSDVNLSIKSLDPQRLAYCVDSLSELFGKHRRLQIMSEGASAENVRFIIDKKPFAFSQLSDGFKSIVSLYMDIANTAMNLGFERAEDFNGIVIIDELGTHLHPRWRMKIVKSLRQLFPDTQFMCCSHEPLCLRGLKDDEVRVLRRSNSRVKFVDGLPPVSGLTAEQLLTSAHFGLNSTLDPETEADFAEYYALLYKQTKGEDLSTVNLSRLEVLRSSLAARGAGTGIFSGTRRDQLVYQTIDRMIAKSPERDIMDALNDDLITELDVLWTQAAGR